MKRNLYILLGVIVLIGIALYQNAGPGIQAAFQHEKPMLPRRGPKPGCLLPHSPPKGWTARSIMWAEPGIKRFC
ncbi:hypothetical protein CM49_00421 [Paenibacillus sp. P1XP2]|nr:hypothetical protein CM49_00421 [Paenibacillus sp. P1XP2]